MLVRAETIICFGKNVILSGKRGSSNSGVIENSMETPSVPITYVSSNNFRLGSWLHGQKRIGKRLPPERIKELRECGVVIE
jgi:hypothetical protein